MLHSIFNFTFDYNRVSHSLPLLQRGGMLAYCFTLSVSLLSHDCSHDLMHCLVHFSLSIVTTDRIMSFTILLCSVSHSNSQSVRVRHLHYTLTLTYDEIDQHKRMSKDRMLCWTVTSDSCLYTWYLPWLCLFRVSVELSWTVKWSRILAYCQVANILILVLLAKFYLRTFCNLPHFTPKFLSNEIVSRFYGSRS